MKRYQQAKISTRKLGSNAILLSATVLMISMGTAQAAGADTYPERPITLVVPYAPGGGVDGVARILAAGLTKILRQSVIIDNKPGAGGTIGAAAVQRSPGDGYTLLMADPAFAISPSIMRLSYNIAKDFKAVSTITTSPLVLSVPAASSIKSAYQLEDMGRKSTRGYFYSSAGVGTSPHMAGELFALRAKAKFIHVPYRGSGPAMADLLAGNIDFSFSTIAAAVPFIREGKLRALAVTGPTRVADLPDAVPLAESLPGFNVRFWTALMVPAGTDPEIIRKLNQATKSALESPEVEASLSRIGETRGYSDAARSQAFIIDEYKKWAVVVKEANVKVD